MSLAEKLAQPPVAPAKQYCTVGKLAEQVEEEDRIALFGAMRDPAWTASDLRAALDAEGHKVSLRHVQEHRKGKHDSRVCMYPNVGLLS